MFLYRPADCAVVFMSDSVLFTDWLYCTDPSSSTAASLWNELASLITRLSLWSGAVVPRRSGRLHASAVHARRPLHLQSRRNHHLQRRTRPRDLRRTPRHLPGTAVAVAASSPANHRPAHGRSFSAPKPLIIDNIFLKTE